MKLNESLASGVVSFVYVMNECMYVLGNTLTRFVGCLTLSQSNCGWSFHLVVAKLTRKGKIIAKICSLFYYRRYNLAREEYRYL